LIIGHIVLGLYLSVLGYQYSGDTEADDYCNNDVGGIKQLRAMMEVESEVITTKKKKRSAQ